MPNTKIRRILGCLCLAMALAACSQQSSTPTVAPAIQTPGAVPQQQPSTGNASVSGRVLDPQKNPLVNTTVQLAEVYRDGSNAGDGGFVLNAGVSPRTETDANGNFLFQNIAAREYVVVIGDPENKYKILPGEDKKPKVINPTDNNTLEMNEIVIDLDAPDQ